MPNFEYQKKEQTNQNQETYRPGEGPSDPVKKEVEKTTDDRRSGSGKSKRKRSQRPGSSNRRSEHSQNRPPRDDKSPRAKSSKSLLGRLVDKVKVFLGNDKKKHTGNKSRVRSSVDHSAKGRQPTPRTPDQEEKQNSTASRNNKNRSRSRGRGGRSQGRNQDDDRNTNKSSANRSGRSQAKKGEQKSRGKGGNSRRTNNSSPDRSSSAPQKNVKRAERRENPTADIPSPSELAAMHTRKPVRDYRNSRKKRKVVNEFNEQPAKSKLSKDKPQETS